MQAGHPLNVKAMLPGGVTPDDLIVLGAAVGVFMICWSLGQIFTTRDPLGPRLKAIEERRAELKGKLSAAKRRQKTGGTSTMSMMRRTVQQLKLLQQLKIDQLQYKLTQAGYRSKDAMIVFAFAKLVMPFAGLVLGVVLSGIDWSNAFDMDQAGGWFVLLICGYLGARLPELVVANTKTRRHQAVLKALPDAIDLMMICSEAGLSLAATLDRVSRELGRMSPVIAEEFSLTSVELGFLPERSMALRHLAQRVDIKEMRGMVNVIMQTEKYGTPIAQALRTLAKAYRMERMLRAEQKAARLPALMTVPMIVFILPSLFIIVMTPAVLSIMDTM